MRRPSIAILLVGLGFAALPAEAMPHDHEFTPPAPFQLLAPAIGGVRAADPAPAYLTAARIAAVGDGALAIDADSGALVLAGADGAARARLAIGHDAGLLAYDPVARVAYVADRRGDRVVVASVGDDRLALARSWKTPAEPYAVALAPDRTTLLVATIADRALVAYDAATGRERWRAPLAAEPRGLAIAPRGDRALIGYLATGTVDELALAAPHAATHVALEAADGTVARGAFAATFLGDDLAVTSFQRDRPSGGEFDEEESTDDRYGGSFNPPITYDLAFLGRGRADTVREIDAVIGAQQPRAIAWDGARDMLYIAGLGNDLVVRVEHASTLDVAAFPEIALLGKGTFPGPDRCGPDGLAVTPGGELLVWCSFTRSVVRVDPSAKKPLVAHGPALTDSVLDDEQHTGYVIFHTADANVSGLGALACASCHLDGRTDGVSWLIHGHPLNTPLLSGRVVGTAPFKWDGTAADLQTSLAQTVERLGGSGLAKRHLAALSAYLESMAPVRAPSRVPDQVARGRALFDASGCASCHEGALYTDGAQHAFAGTLARTDTPSLIGVAASAPYFHDGSAATLDVVLRDRGSVHGMLSPSLALSNDQLADLRAFLESL
jgi:hypothetical protein